MAEYIEREAAIKAIYESDPNGIRRTLGFNVGQIEEALRAIPAADVAPVRHGRWVMSSDRPDTIICTCCDSTFELGTDEMGVRMIDLGSADEELQKHIRQFLQLVAGFMGWYGHGE